MRILISIVILLAVITVGIYGFGVNLPETHKTIRTATYHQPAQALWPLVANYEKAPEWSSNIRKVERREDKDSLPVWRFYDKRGHYMDIQVLRSEEPRMLISRIIETDMPFGGTWTIELKPSAETTATEVTLMEEGIVKSPFWRFLCHFLMGSQGMVDQYLTELGKAVGETPSIR